MESFYNGKKVFVTGHTGFKGTWLCQSLLFMGAEVCGYSLAPNTEPSIFRLSSISNKIISIEGDIRNYNKLSEAINNFMPDIVIHMAAQPIVRESYRNPIHTYDVNVMGTVYLLESIRHCSSVKSVVNVTTDKVYKNNEWEWGYREIDVLDGFDPYSNSKSCSELVTSSYINSFFSGIFTPAVSTARAGNVIGGGDFAADRIIPDCVRAVTQGNPIIIRNPYSIRPYEHVLEPVFAYLLLAMRQYQDKVKFSGCYNIGPNDADCVNTGKLVDLFCSCWGSDARWITQSEDNAPHEATFLKLDHSKITSVLGWKPRWEIKKAVEMTVGWSKFWLSGGDVSLCMEEQIKEYLEADI